MKTQSEKEQETVQEKGIKSEDSNAQADSDTFKEEPEKSERKPRLGLGYCHEWGNPFNIPGF